MPPVPKQPPNHPPGTPQHFVIGRGLPTDGTTGEPDNLWWRLAEQECQQKAAVIEAKEKELIERAKELAAREAEVAAIRGAVINEGAGIAEELATTQRQQAAKDQEQKAREQVLIEQHQEAHSLLGQERQRIQDHAERVALDAVIAERQRSEQNLANQELQMKAEQDRLLREAHENAAQVTREAVAAKETELLMTAQNSQEAASFTKDQAEKLHQENGRLDAEVRNLAEAQQKQLEALQRLANQLQKAATERDSAQFDAQVSKTELERERDKVDGLKSRLSAAEGKVE